VIGYCHGVAMEKKSQTPHKLRSRNDKLSLPMIPFGITAAQLAGDLDKKINIKNKTLKTKQKDTFHFFFF